MLTACYDNFQFVTNDPVFADSIAKGHTEPYPYDIDIVQKYLRAFPTRCRTYVDVGAHIGTTLAPYSRMFSDLFGFEANPETFELLKQNISNNNIRCKLESVGLYSHPCRGYIRQHSGGNSGCFYFQEDKDGPVECKTLDQYNLTNVDFLKIDTEGSELYVLQGAEQTIRTFKPLIQIECNSLSQSLFGIQTPAIVEYLHSLGYRLYDSGQANLFFYYPRMEPYTLFCFWTGKTPMSESRKRCFEAMKDTGCSVVCVTSENLSNYIVTPLHPAYEYLSEVHKADYLRTYFMHHYGGGYSDIKHQTGPWKPWVDMLDNSDAYILGYSEEKTGDIAYAPVSHAWKELIGNGAYICKPNTPLTLEWFNTMNALLDEKIDELRNHPATCARDAKDLGTGYPIEWNEMLGRIFHKVCYSHRDRILHGLPAPLFYDYL
jgi:FkbM family methyltransferase